MEFRNDSPQGDLFIPGIGFVAHGATFEASGDDAEPFLAQPDVYTHVVEHRDGTKSDAPKPVREPHAGVYITTGEHPNDTGDAPALADLATLGGEPAAGGGDDDTEPGA